MLKNTLLIALIATVPALAQDVAPQLPEAPTQQPRHWGARGEMPNRPNKGDMHKRMLDKFDADKDGQLSDDERNAMKAEMEKRRAERPEGFRPGKRGERPEGFQPGKRGERPEGFQPGKRGERPKGFQPGKSGERPEGFQPGKRGERPEGFRPGKRHEGFEGAKSGNRRRPHSERPQVLPMLPPTDAAPEAPVAPAPQQ